MSAATDPAPPAPQTATGRVVALLRHVARGGATSNLSELARLTGVNRVTAMRLLEDLEAEGMLERTPGGGHRLGLDFLKLAGQAVGAADLTDLGRRSLRALSERLQLTAYLVVLDGAHVLYLLRSMPATPLVSNIAVGSRVPAHQVTPGRVLLADHDEDRLRALLGPEPLAASGPGTPATYDALLALVAEDRARGTAWSSGAYEPGVDACAAAVRGADGPVAALSVAGPTAPLDGRRAEIEQAVAGEAAELSVMLAR
jgi:IclR family acetate operon transcriptional repressor